ncbi:MAG: hypothetical protein R2827_14525 [Bdellovibrionales bacterium]
MIDFGLITDNERLLKRAKSVCAEFDYSFMSWSNLEEFFEAEQHCKMITFSVDGENSKDMAAKAAEAAQLAKAYCEDGYLVSIVSKDIPRDDVEFIKKSGVNLVFPEYEMFETSKLDFFASQILRAKYVPIKDSDLLPDTVLNFDLYHLMPLRNKFLKITRKGFSIPADKLKKMQEIREFYILRDELPDFKIYAEKISDDSHSGVLRKCRAQFLEFSGAYLDLIEMMCDESQSVGFEEGKKILQNCQNMVVGLAQTLAQVSGTEVWDIINNSVIGEFGSVERMPAVAAYATHFADKLEMEMDVLINIIFVILVMDVGIIKLSPDITRKLREGKDDKFSKQKSNPIEAIQN